MHCRMSRVMLISISATLFFTANIWNINQIEFRRGSAGGGNQLRQPYLRHFLNSEEQFSKYPNTEHVHFFGFYIGNFPELTLKDIDFICSVINAA